VTASSEPDLEPLQKKLGHSFRDPSLLERALTHKSHAHEAGQSEHHNESLEFLGDSILGFLVTDLIYQRFPTLNEGRKSKIKAYLVSAVALSDLALDLDLPKYLRLGKGEEKTGGRRKQALRANALEAILAAIYLDAGIDAARAFVEPLYQQLFQEVADLGTAVEDPKTKLQEHLQAAHLPPAEYVITKEKGPEHRKTFHVNLLVGERMLANTTGSTKKKAQLRAARIALEKLQRDTPSEPTEDSSPS
jgi:ribonuclease-3